jgi:hypothetical protein
MCAAGERSERSNSLPEAPTVLDKRKWGFLQEWRNEY